MIERPGSKLLYRAATGLEKAMADADAPRLLELNAEIVIGQWDPYAIAFNNLPVLAWGMGTRLWDDGWRENTKREWTAEQWKFQALRGTRAGVAMALKYMGRDFTGGYDLIDALTAPQGFFASPDLPKSEWDEWIRQMPELRIKLAHGTGLADGEFYVLDGFAGANHCGRDDGRALYGRRTILRRSGQPDQELGLVEWQTTIERIDFEQVSIPGAAGAAFMIGDFESDDRFVGAEALAPRLYSFQLDRAYDHVTSALHLSTIAPGLDPLNVQYERVSDVGWGNSFFFGRDFSGEYFADNGRDAAELLADRIFLLDPNVATPLTAGVSFAGADRVDFPPYHAELMVDLWTTEPNTAFIVDEEAAADAFAIPDDFTDFDRAMRSICAAKALRDKVMADFAVTHAFAFGDPITLEPPTRFGDQRPSWL